MIGRWIAGLVMIASAATLAWHHRDDLFPSQDQTAPVNPELEACLDQRYGDIDTMMEEGLLSEAQLAQFRTRAEAFCQSTTAQ